MDRRTGKQMDADNGNTSSKDGHQITAITWCSNILLGEESERVAAS